MLSTVSGCVKEEVFDVFWGFFLMKAIETGN